jgi:hypothetical protein
MSLMTNFVRLYYDVTWGNQNTLFFFPMNLVVESGLFGVQVCVPVSRLELCSGREAHQGIKMLYTPNHGNENCQWRPCLLCCRCNGPSIANIGKASACNIKKKNLVRGKRGRHCGCVGCWRVEGVRSEFQWTFKGTWQWGGLSAGFCRNWFP